MSLQPIQYYVDGQKVHGTKPDQPRVTFCNQPVDKMRLVAPDVWKKALPHQLYCPVCKQPHDKAKGAEQMRLLAAGHPETVVKVALMGDDVTHKVWIRVSVGSIVRPGLWAHKDVNADSTRLEYDVEKTAEALALHQVVNYCDAHNSTSVGKAAVEALRELQASAAANKPTFEKPE